MIGFSSEVLEEKEEKNMDKKIRLSKTDEFKLLIFLRKRDKRHERRR